MLTIPVCVHACVCMHGGWQVLLHFWILNRYKWSDFSLFPFTTFLFFKNRIKWLCWSVDQMSCGWFAEWPPYTVDEVIYWSPRQHYYVGGEITEHVGEFLGEIVWTGR